jgi:hypothetical protein
MPDSWATGNLAMTLLLLGSVAVWMRIGAKRINGEDALPWMPREPCPWHAAAVALSLPVSIVVQYVVSSSAPEHKLHSIAHVQDGCLAKVLEILVLMGLLALATPIRARNFGLHPSGLVDDVKFGLAGFLAAWGPVCAVSYAVNRLGLREEGAKHLYLRVLEENPGAGTVGWIVLSAVVLAPIAEELLYRVVLQGWLETRLTPRAAILFVGILFACVHYAPGRPDHLPLLPLALILGYVYYRRHSYLTVVILHAAFNGTNLALKLLSGDE